MTNLLLIHYVSQFDILNLGPNPLQRTPQIGANSLLLSFNVFDFNEAFKLSKLFI